MPLFRISRIGIQLLVLLVLAMPLVVTTGCKSKKKKAELERLEAERRQREAQINNAKATLQGLLDSPFSKTYEELRRKEQQLEEIKSLNLDDAEVRVLISEVESKLRQEREALDAMQRQKEETPKPVVSKNELDGLFNSIASAGSVDAANRQISSALSYFASRDVPVLIVINQSGGTKDYDRPTTIQKYLNYLKDQQRNTNMVQNITFDNNGKISELELLKQR